MITPFFFTQKACFALYRTLMRKDRGGNHYPLRRAPVPSLPLYRPLQLPGSSTKSDAKAASLSIPAAVAYTRATAQAFLSRIPRERGCVLALSHAKIAARLSAACRATSSTPRPTLANLCRKSWTGLTISTFIDHVFYTNNRRNWTFCQLHLRRVSERGMATIRDSNVVVKHT